MAHHRGFSLVIGGYGKVIPFPPIYLSSLWNISLTPEAADVQGETKMPKRKGLPVSHLIYADDLPVFSEATLTYLHGTE